MLPPGTFALRCDYPSSSLIFSVKCLLRLVVGDRHLRTETAKLDVVWRVREEMIEGPQADTGGGKRAASRPQVAQESLQGHPKVTSHVMDVTPKAENTFEVAWEV